MSNLISNPAIASRSQSFQPAPQRRAKLQSDGRFAHYIARPILRLGPIVFSAAVTAMLVLAWVERDEGYLTAESGPGYWLGIIGAVLMLLLLLYPLRKRYRPLHTVGRVANWFRAHMVLGILAPSLVVLHTNFKLGSLNSQLALATMLVVVASGIAGRYLYAKVHKGLYGSHAQMRDVAADITALKTSISHSLGETIDAGGSLDRYAADAQKPRSFLFGFYSALVSGVKTRAARQRILSSISRQIRRHPAWRQSSYFERRRALSSINQQLKLFFAAVRKAERLAFFERLFGKWHHLHVPLFSMLVITVVIHVIAVHRY